MIHHLKLVLRPELAANYVKQLELDTSKNIAIVRLKSSDILVIQLVARKNFCTIIERIQNPYDQSDPVQSFKWLSRMKCYAEGSSKGILRICDIEKQGECMMNLNTGFQDRV